MNKVCSTGSCRSLGGRPVAGRGGGAAGRVLHHSPVQRHAACESQLLLVSESVSVQPGRFHALSNPSVSAVVQFHHRDPGIVGLLTSDRIPAGRAVYYGMIADGIHTNPAALRIAHRAHPSGLPEVSISDQQPKARKSPQIYS